MLHGTCEVHHVWVLCGAKNWLTLLDLRVASWRRGHANLLCIARGGNSCLPKSMTLAELKPAIFGSEDPRFIFAQQAEVLVRQASRTCRLSRRNR